MGPSAKRQLPDQQFWKGKRVLVTGHTGFKGSWMSLWLTKLGAKVTGIALEPATEPNLFSATKLSEIIDHNIVDICDFEKFSAAVKKCNPEVIIHMAAQALVLESYEDPLRTYATNVMGTANVLQIARSISDLKAVCVVTSDKCYENFNWERGYHEEDRMGGDDPYSNSKGCAELVTHAMRKSFFESSTQERAKIFSVRAGNVYGGGDWSKYRIIPDAVKAFANKKSLEIRNPHALRPWQHVLEPVRGYLIACEATIKGEQKPEAWNFGPLDVDTVPVEELIGKFCKAWGEGAQWNVLTQTNKPHEAHTLRLDITKVQAKLGWKPGINLTAGLAATAAWYKNFFATQNAKDSAAKCREFSLAQIKQMEQLWCELP